MGVGVGGIHRVSLHDVAHIVVSLGWGWGGGRRTVSCVLQCIGLTAKKYVFTQIITEHHRSHSAMQKCGIFFGRWLATSDLTPVPVDLCWRCRGAQWTLRVAGNGVLGHAASEQCLRIPHGREHKIKKGKEEGRRRKKKKEKKRQYVMAYRAPRTKNK